MAHTGTRWRSVASRRTGLAALAAAAVATWAAPARAEPGTDGRFEVRAGLLRFDYEERDRNAFLDGEEGFVPQLTVEGEVRVDRFFGRAMFRLAKGSVDYTGSVQSTDASLDGLPVQATSDATLLQGELQAGGFLDEGRRLALFGAFGARQWTRDIQGTTVTSRTNVPTQISGLSEVYTWYELQAGARWIFLERAGTGWDVDVRLVRTFAANISVDLSPFGGPSSVEMGLGSRTGWRVGSTFRQDLEGTLFLAATVWAEGYAFGRSDVHTVTAPLGAGGILEPDSSTVNVALELGIGGRF